MKVEDKKKRLEEIAKKVAECRRCPLYQRATKPVPGEGNPEAQLIFIGEGPGYWEDQRGIPFCGASGKLLDKLLASIGLRRDEVWIGNVVKHRPPGNRDPLPEEIEACRPFLDEQIKVLDPKVIVTLGRFSLGKFLPGEYISRIHGQARFVDFAGRRRIIIPMYHPAAALRNGRVMAAIQEDFKKILRFLEAPVEEEVAAEEEKAVRQDNQQLSLIN